MYWGCDPGFGPPSGLKVPGQVTPGGLVVVADHPAEGEKPPPAETAALELNP